MPALVRSLTQRCVSAALLATLPLVSACDMTKFTANQTAPVLQAAQPAFTMEPDPELARAAAPAQLKTVEGFYLAARGENKLYTAILAQGFCEYAFGFLESDAEEAEMAGDTDKATALGKRATGLYLRCMEYGLELLDSGWKKDLYGDSATFDKRVAGASKGDVPGMFWTAFGLASAINLNRDDIEMVAFLPKAKALMERIAVLQPTFNNGMALGILGIMSTAQGAALGGNPEGGKALFEKAIAMTDGKYLMWKVMLARFYATIVQDQNLFHKTLVEVLTTSPAIWPEQRLPNELAHIRARRYLAHEKELF